MASDDDIQRVDVIRARLQDACRGFDDAGAELAADDLIAEIRRLPEPINEAEATKVMKLLRRRRLFRTMERLGDALILSGQDSAEVRRLYAQSQLDEGNISSAIRVLERLRDDCAPDGGTPNSHEHAEAVGLLGRACKQQYVDAGHPGITRNRHSLSAAVDYYHSIFSEDEDQLWHGVNAFALLERAMQDGVHIGDRDDERAGTIANKLESSLDDLDARQELRAWDLATGVELYCGLAVRAARNLDEDKQRAYLDKAAVYLEKYGKDDNADAFELASTLRQLEEVWRLDPDSPFGDHILAPLEVALLSRNGGAITANSQVLDAALNSAGLEKVFGAGGFVTANWVEQCQGRLRSVCRIEGGTGRNLGTGFLISGAELSPALAGQDYVLTNHHVVNESGGVMQPYHPVAHFEAANIKANVTEVVWQSPRGELDAAVLALDADAANLPDPIEVVRPLPEAGQIDDSYRTFIIGHPKGNPLSVSLHDNFTLDVDDRVLHYRTPTEPGSSGSPVFDEDWVLVALHHAGKEMMDKLNGKQGYYEANEGIRLDVIQAAIRRDLGTPEPSATATPVRTAMTPTAALDLSQAESSASAPQRRFRTVCDMGFRDLEVLDRDDLEPGDILLFRANDNGLSQLITSLDGYWSHSAIYVGDGLLAHAFSAGIKLMSLTTVMGYYDEGYGVARPTRSGAQRQAAADYARRISHEAGTEYSGRDLGLAASVLARARVRDFLDQMLSMGRSAPASDGDGLEGLFQRAEIEHTCSGFVYACYAQANNGDPGPLNIVPAPGIELRDGHLFVASGLESGDPGDMTVLEAMAAETAEEEGLEGIPLPNWKSIKSKLELYGGAGIGIATSAVKGGRIPIESGVTPADLWCSPEIASRWFLSEEARDIAARHAQHCPPVGNEATAPGALSMMDLTEFDEVLEAYPANIQASLDAIAEQRRLLVESEGLEFLVDDLQSWLPGSTLRVAFLGGSSELHHNIVEVVAEIDDACSLTFDFGYDAATDTFRAWTTDDKEHVAEIRVSFDMPGYFSLVGTDSMNAAISGPEQPVGGHAHQRSLNLGGYDDELPTRWRGTVLHEFLHAIAFLHEHQNPRSECHVDFRWDDDPGYVRTTDDTGRFVADGDGRRPGIYTYLSGPPNNWIKATIDHNLRMDPDAGTAARFDPDSVMLYRFPPLFYKSDPSPCAPTSDGQQLSDGDKRGLALLYPESATARDTHKQRASQARDQLGVILDEGLEALDLRDAAENAIAMIDRQLNED